VGRYSADEVKEAATKLADKPNYSWTGKSQSTQTNRFRGDPPEGKTEKGGFTVLTFKNGENSTIAVRKGEKVALKQDDEWKTGEELADPTGGGGGGNGGFNRGGLWRAACNEPRCLPTKPGIAWSRQRAEEG